MKKYNRLDGMYLLLTNDINNQSQQRTIKNLNSIEERKRIFNHYLHIISFLERNGFLHENDISYLVDKLYDFYLYQPNIK